MNNLQPLAVKALRWFLVYQNDSRWWLESEVTKGAVMYSVLLRDVFHTSVPTILLGRRASWTTKRSFFFCRVEDEQTSTVKGEGKTCSAGRELQARVLDDAAWLSDAQPSGESAKRATLSKP
eukprot:4880713-Amphidinium_carterae.1